MKTNDRETVIEKNSATSMTGTLCRHSAYPTTADRGDYSFCSDCVERIKLDTTPILILLSRKSFTKQSISPTSENLPSDLKAMRWDSTTSPWRVIRIPIHNLDGQLVENVQEGSPLKTTASDSAIGTPSSSFRDLGNPRRHVDW